MDVVLFKALFLSHSEVDLPFFLGPYDNFSVISRPSFNCYTNPMVLVLG